MNQRGVTFLEIIVVVAILAVTSMLVAPSIDDWRQKRALEADFNAVLAQIDYLKTRTRNLGGTAVLICTQTAGGTSILTYQISTNPQTSVSAVDSKFSQLLVEDPTSKSAGFNVLSGNTVLSSTICTGNRGIISSAGKSGVENYASPANIDIRIFPLKLKDKLGGYEISLYPSTGFIQKFKTDKDGVRIKELD